MSFFDKAAVVITGASGGVGAAVSEALARRGAATFELDVREPQTCHGTYVAVDVSDPSSVDAAMAEVVRRAGRIDALVTAAGLAEPPTPAEEMSVEAWDRTLTVNLRGTFLSCRAAARHMLARGAGRIVTIASMSGNHVVNVPQQQAAYNASKAGVVALTKSLALEWAPRGIRVNALSPGYIDTPMLANKPEMHERWKAATPVGRFATTDEISAAALWMLSDEAGFLVGAELLMDGGYSLA